jgi:phosphate transport system permease protein
VAFATIRLLSWTAVVALALVLGFVLWRGFVSQGELRAAEVGYREERLARDGVELVVATHVDSTLEAISGTQLFEAYTDEYLDWTELDGRGDEIVPLSIDPATAEGAAADAIVFGDAAMADYFRGGLVKVMPDAATALEELRANPGALALIPASLAAGAEGIRLVPIERLSVAVAPEVTAIFGNDKLDSLSQADFERVKAGEARSWADVRGPALPITRAMPPADSELGSLAKAAGFSGDVIASTMEEYRSWFAPGSPYPGAIGLEFSAALLLEERPHLTVARSYLKPNLALSFLLEEPRLSGKVGGISTILANTFFMILLTLLLAIPLGLGAAVYLVEYAKEGSFVRILRIGVETLSGVPSIVFGLFGMAAFVPIFGLGLASGSLTLAVMLLPTVVRTAEEAIKAVPVSYREGSLALGASKSRTIARVVLPAASGGIATGVILAIGRALGETAALVFTMGSGYALASGLDSSARSLAVHVYLLTAEGISFDKAFASAAVLVAFVFIVNTIAGRLMRDRNKR